MKSLSNLLRGRQRDHDTGKPRKSRTHDRLHRSPRETFAVVLEVDGVLTVGESGSPDGTSSFGILKAGAVVAISLLQTYSIPFVIKTNAQNPFDGEAQARHFLSLLDPAVRDIAHGITHTLAPFSRLHLPPFDYIAPRMARRCQDRRVLVVADNPVRACGMLFRAGYKQVMTTTDYKLDDYIRDGQIAAILVMSAPSPENHKRYMEVIARTLDCNLYCHLVFCGSDYDRVLGYPLDRNPLDADAFLREAGKYYPARTREGRRDTVYKRVIRTGWPDAKIPRGTLDLCDGQRQRQMEVEMQDVYRRIIEADVEGDKEVHLARDQREPARLDKVYVITSRARGEAQAMIGGENSTIGVKYEVVAIGDGMVDPHASAVSCDVLQAVRNVLSKEGCLSR